MASGEVLAELVLEGADSFQGDMKDTQEQVEKTGESARDASGGFDEAEQGLLDIDEAGAAAGAALAGVGAGMQTALDNSRQTRATLNRTAVTLGTTREETNKLARELSSANTPISEVSTTMDLLAQQGVESEDQMRSLTSTISGVSNATGLAADELTRNMGAALRAMGNDMSDASEKADTFTFVANETSLTMDRFADALRESGPELQEMGLSIEDSAALLAAMQEEGIQGEEAMTRLRQAIEDGAKSQEDLANKLGVSTSTIKNQRSELRASEGITQEYASANNEAASTMDRLKSAFNDTMTLAGSMLQPISALAPALMALGAAQSLVASINFGAVVPSLTAVATAAAPVVVPLLAIVAAASALALAWKNNFLGIRDKTKAAVEFITNILGKGKEIIGNVIGGMLDFFGDLKDKPLETIKSGFNSIISFITKWSPAAIVARKAAEVISSLDLVDKAKQAGRNLINAFVDGIKALANLPGKAAEEIVQGIRAKLPGSDADEGPLSDLTASSKSLPQTLAQGMAEGEGEVNRAASRLADAANPASGQASTATGAGAGGGASGTTEEVKEVRIMTGDQTLNEIIRDRAEVVVERKDKDRLQEHRRDGVRR